MHELADIGNLYGVNKSYFTRNRVNQFNQAKIVVNKWLLVTFAQNLKTE